MDHSPASRFSVENLSPTSPGGRNEYPFPRPGSSGSRLYPRRGSTASSIHSIGGTLDSVSQWHGFNESGQNGATYDALQRAKENEEEGGTQLLRKGNKADDFADILDFDGRSPKLSRKSSLASLASLDTPSASTRKKSSSGRRAIHAPTPISTVPSVYFEEDFHLENPRTFDVVSERSEVIRPTTGSPDERRASNGSTINPRKALATNAILQEKLSWYMDTIEVHLISSISTASTSFFAALGSLRELHSEAAVSVERIKTLRKELEELDEEMAVGGLKIVNLQRRRENLKQLNDAVQQLKQIVNAVASCESMVENGDVEQALDAIDALEKLIAGEEMLSKPGQHKIQLRDLRGAIALQGLEVPGKKNQQEKSMILARNLRSLDPDDAEELLKKTYIQVGETLRRLGTQVKVLLDVTSTLGDPDTPGDLRGNSGRELQEEMHQTLDMSNLLGQAVDIAQDKIVKVLRVRTEQSTHLSVERFLRYFTLNLLFANECEAVSGRSGTSLKNVVNGHIKDYVQQLGESERQSLATGMEADPWNAKDFTDEDKELLSRILSASTQDVEAWSSGSKVWQSCTDSPLETQTLLTPPSNGNQKNGTSTPNSTSTPSKAQTRSAVVDDQSYILPISAILCLHGLATLLHLNTGIPSMTSEIATSILSYLTLFNSRVQQLILGAGATTTAGLKNITTKHLALAAQATSFISVLIPYIREYVRRNAGTGSSVSVLMGEFDKIRRSYLEHQQLIYDKFLSIMSGRATAHIKSMKMIDWDDATRAASINTYMETMTKETLTLHKVLNKHLPDMTVNMIMELVFKSFREQLGKAFGDVVLGSEDAKARMLRDAQYFKTRIGGLDGANDAGDYIIKVVQDKNVPRNSSSALPATTSPPDTQVTTPTGVTQPVAENGNENGNGNNSGNVNS
ncbi:hypothetical protein H4I95_09015 [Botrytis cinerea]